MKKELSILIPVYNDSCIDIVAQLSAQAGKIDGLSYEIIVGDDGSDNEEIVKENRRIETIANCKVIRYDKNRGRSAIRNTLVAKARYPWLVFIDGGHMRLCSEDYLSEYLRADDSWRVVYGGYCLSELPPEQKKGSLRYKYENRNKQNSSARLRLRAGNVNFHSSNFMARRDVFCRVGFDERFVRYGYEDIFIARDMERNGIGIRHIDNPTVFCGYEDNRVYLEKTVESLLTLKEYEPELYDYSRLLQIVKTIKRTRLESCFRNLYKLKKQSWISNLEGSSPSMLVFDLFKIGFYLNI